MNGVTGTGPEATPSERNQQSIRTTPHETDAPAYAPRPGQQEGDQVVQVLLGEHGAEVRRHGRESGQPPLLDVGRRDRGLLAGSIDQDEVRTVLPSHQARDHAAIAQGKEG